ncbi:MAG: dicarboxylate/amino acid:cation symporter [Methylococcus sp.]|jgi:Na+/H+-dicarboxylate symporter|nr:MAG: dicarboxylate/amino acid:cation symporter [Methylococcus sp.]
MTLNKPSIDSSKASRLITRRVLLAVFLGILVGSFLSFFKTDIDPQTIDLVVRGLKALTDLFLRLIKLLIGPLVLATLTVGVGQMGSGAAVGRIGLRAMTWFISASLLSLCLGMLLVNLLHPGTALHLPLPDAATSIKGAAESLSFEIFLEHLVPASITDALAHNEILQIVVFSVLFGLAGGAIGAPAKPVFMLLESLALVMFRLTSMIMMMAPVAVFSAIASVIAVQGIGILGTYGLLMIEFYCGLFILWSVLILIGRLLMGVSVKHLLGLIKDPMLLAFGTASSEAAYPLLLRQLEVFGCRERVVGMVLPLGYSFNLDGSMMYMTFATLFIAEAYGIDMPLSDQWVMLLMLLITSKGVAGVPRASLLVISATLTHFQIPEAGLLLILGIDPLLDMGRSATNVLGNSLAAAVIDHHEPTSDDL